MALTTITAIKVVDPDNPIEVQTWLSNNALAVIINIIVTNNTFYIVHT